MKGCYYCFHLYIDEENEDQYCSIDPDLDNENGKCVYFKFDNGDQTILTEDEYISSLYPEKRGQ